MQSVDSLSWFNKEKRVYKTDREKFQVTPNKPKQNAYGSLSQTVLARINSSSSNTKPAMTR